MKRACSRIFAVVTLFVMMTISAIAAGCGSDANKPADQSKRPLDHDQWVFSKPPPTTTESNRRAIPIQSQPTLVKQGRLPIVYMVETGDGVIVTVVDQNTGERIASAPVGTRAIIRIEARNGVYYTNEHVLPGPLPADHNYAIYLQSDLANEFEQTGQRPAAPSSPPP